MTWHLTVHPNDPHMFSFRTFATKCCKHAPTNFDFSICLSVRMSVNKKSGRVGGACEGVFIKHYIGDIMVGRVTGDYRQ